MLKFNDAKLKSAKDGKVVEKLYTHDFEFDMEELITDKLKGEITLLDEGNGIKIVVIKRLVDVNDVLFIY